MAKILIIDDDRQFVDAVRTVLQAQGYETAAVYAASEALDAAGREKPDLIILDVMFPEDPAAGFELARRIRRHHEHVPILMLTAVNQRFPLGFSSRDIDPQWLPVSDFVEKPVDLDILIYKVKELLSQVSTGSEQSTAQQD